MSRALPIRRVAIVLLTAGLAGCGSGKPADPTNPTASSRPLPNARPQAIEPTAGVQAQAAAAATPVGDVNAHAPSLTRVKRELRLELVYAPITNANYINPLQYVKTWGRTDQGVDATMPIGAPILAPCRVKILAVIPDWYAGQPLVYFELLEGPDAGRVQYVAEEITDIARPGSLLERGQAIARYARSGTAIEYGWSTLNGVTLAVATTGYEEGQVTPAGQSIRTWLDSLGANAGNYR